MSSSDSDSSSISSVEDPKPKPPPAKKSAGGAAGKASASASSAKAGDKRKRPSEAAADGGDGENRLLIGSNRYVSLSNFRGRFFVDIREFYEDRGSGELKPGKKGIALSLEQWDNLKRKMDAVDKMIKDA